MSENTLSLLDDDKTLPVDFYGSRDPAQLPELTFGSHLPVTDESVSGVAKPDSGHISPIRARTMKEYDQQLSDLKKENFSLKLRIYFLEERIQQQFDGNGETLFKTNIELKVQIENLKKELFEKQDLLKKASTALETISTQHETDLQQAKEFARQEALKEAQDQREILEAQLAEAQQQLLEKDQELATLKLDLEETKQKVKELLTLKCHLEAEVTVSQKRRRELETELDAGLLEDANNEKSSRKAKSMDDLDDRDVLIKQLQNVVKTKELIIEQLEEEMKEELRQVKDKFEAEINKRDAQIKALEKEGQVEKTTHSTIASSASESESEPMSKSVRVSEDLQKNCHTVEDLQRQLEELEKTHSKCKENTLKRDKTIQGLTKVMYERDCKILELNNMIEAKDDELQHLKAELGQLKDCQDLEHCHSELAKQDDEITDLKTALQECQLAKQRLDRSIARREAEVQQLTEQLDKAESAVSQKDDTIQHLRETLQQEKQKQSSVADLLEKHFQILLDDQQRRIESQEKMLQRMTRSLRDKDKQLQDMVSAQGAVGEKSSKDVLIENLKSQLADKDKQMEEYISEHYKSLDAKDAEIRQLKMSLKERDHDIAKASQMLLVSEEAIDNLESESRQKTATIKQLAMALKTQERALEEAAESHEHSLAEKNALLEKLLSSLNAREKHLQDAIHASPAASNKLVQQLQAQLQDKDRMLQELIAEHGEIIDRHDKAVRELLNKLMLKDDQMKDLEQTHQQEVSRLTHDVQTLQGDIHRKDYQIQTLENNVSWMESQHRQILDKLRAILNEKDKTIEALVESGREKDALFRRLQDSVGADITHSSADGASKTLEIQELKDQVMLLSSELLNKEAIITHLKSEVDRLNARSDMMANASLKDAQQLTEIRLQKWIASCGPSCSRCRELQAQLDELRAQLDRLILLQRNQTLGGSTNQSDDESRPNTEDGRCGNSGQVSDIQLHAITDSLYRRCDGGQNVSRLRQQVLILQTQLEDKDHWNNKLQQQLQQVELALSEANQAGNPNQSRSKTDGYRMGGDQTQVGQNKGQTSSTTGQKLKSAANSDWMFEVSNELTDGLCNSYLPSFMDLPDGSLDERSLSQMTTEDLLQLVRTLKQQLAQLLRKRSAPYVMPNSMAANGTAGQTVGTPQTNGVSGQSPEHSQTDGNQQFQVGENKESDASGMIEQLKQQLKQTQEALNKRDEELQMLKSVDRGEIQKQVAKLSIQLQHVEHLNELLKKQVKLNADAEKISSSPELISNMAKEIDRLKKELAKTRDLLETQENSENNTVPKVCEIKLNSVGSSYTDLKDAEREMDALKRELADIKRQNFSLKSMLASTEATVHNQADRMKRYRNQLEEAGILLRSPVRSCSESNLSIVGQMSAMKHASSTDELPDVSLPGIDLSKLTSYGQTDSIKQLKKEIAELQNCCMRYNQAMVSLRSCVASTTASNSSDSSSDLTKKPSPSHIPVPTARLRTISASSTSTSCSTAAMPSSAAAQQLQKLKQEVDRLRQQLVDSDTKNADLMEQVEEFRQKAMNVNRHDKACQITYADNQNEKLLKLQQEHHVEKQSLVKQLSESSQLCENLQSRLDELSSLLEELLHQNPKGDVDVVNMTQSRVDQCRALLTDSRHLASDLSTLMESASEESLLSDFDVYAPSNNTGGSVTLQRKYDLAQQEIKQLKEHLAQFMQKQDNSLLENLLVELREDNKNLHASLSQSEQDKDDLKAKLEHLEEERFKEKEQCLNVSQDVKDLKKQLSCCKEHNQHLEKKLSENSSLKTEMEKTINNLKCELSKNSSLKTEMEKTINNLKSEREDLLWQVKQSQQQQQIELKEKVLVDEEKRINSRHHSERCTSDEQLGGDAFNTEMFSRRISNISMESLEQLRQNTTTNITVRSRHTTNSSDDMTTDMSVTSDLINDSFLPHGKKTNGNNQGMGTVHSKGSMCIQTSHCGVLDGDTLDPIRMQLEMSEELSSLMQAMYQHVSDHETSLSVSVRSSSPMQSTAVQTRAQSPDHSCLDLATYMEEVRALRKKLEQAINKNNRLRETLERRLAMAKKENREVFLKVEQSLQAEIESANRQLQARTRQLNNITQELVAKDTSLKAANEKLSQLQANIKERDQEIKKYKLQIKRLESDVSRLQDQLQENTDLNKTLKRQLRIYDSFTPNQSHSTEKSTKQNKAISMLMDEVKELCKMLERSIENNNLLREKLEQSLAQGSADNQRDLTMELRYINQSAMSKSSSTSAGSQTSNSDAATQDKQCHTSPSLPSGFPSNVHSSNQKSGDDILRYNITDPNRPPSKLEKVQEGTSCTSSAANGTYSPQSQNTGVTAVRVSSDLRCLFAVGAIDDYELLKKQLQETELITGSLLSLLSGTRSVDGSTLRQTVSSIDNLDSLAKKQKKLMSKFWLTQLSRDNSTDRDLVKENEDLYKQISILKRKYARAKEVGLSAANSLAAQNRLKENMEEEIKKELVKTYAVLRQAKANLSEKLVNPSNPLQKTVSSQESME